MRLDDDVKLDFKDVLIRPKRSTLRSRKDVDLGRDYHFRHSGLYWKGIPIMASNMDTIGSFEMHAALKEHYIFTAIHKYYTLEDWKKNIHMFFPYYGAISIGARDEELDKFEAIRQLTTDFLEFVCIDVANGYGEYFVDFVQKARKRFPEVTIIAGNVVTAEMTEQLILSGADIVKVGIGSGSVCTTRLKTGVGYPQLSAIIECADAAHGLKGHIISDGGCRCPGDVAKAFGAGADFVMLGGMLAGHDECGSIDEKGNMKFYGMSSETAQERYHGGPKAHRASEGRTIDVAYKGRVIDTIREISGGLRSTCTYVGAPSLKQLSKCTTFIRVTQQHEEYEG